MKALTLYQPWATAMAIGLKTVETRAWKINYRGPVVIHSAQKCTREMNRKFAELLHGQTSDAFVFRGSGYVFFSDLPFGQSIAIGDLVDVVPVETLIADGRATVTQQRWGDYSAGRFGWIFANLRRFERPRHVSGAQGLWEWRHGAMEVSDSVPSVQPPSASVSHSDPAGRLPTLPAYRLPPQIQRPPFATA